MVRFTLRDTRRSASLRLDMGLEDDVREIGSIASEYWGEQCFLIRNGYNLIDPDGSIGDSVREGDLVELIPDPTSFRF